MILAMPDRLTWKSVFFIWMLCVPFVGGAGYVLFQKYPGPFQDAAAWTQKRADAGKKVYKTFQDKRAKDKAAEDKKAKEETEAANGY